MALFMIMSSLLLLLLLPNILAFAPLQPTRGIVHKLQPQQRNNFFSSSFFHEGTTTRLSSTTVTPSSLTKSSSSSNEQQQSSSSTGRVVEIAEGLSKTILKEGNGVPLRNGNFVFLSQTSYLAPQQDEEVAAAIRNQDYVIAETMPFSRDPNQRNIVGAGDMIPGWEQGLATMSVGEHSILHIRNPELGYGAQGYPPLIPPNAALDLDIQIFKSQSRAEFERDFLTRPADPTLPQSIDEITDIFEKAQEKKNLKPEKNWVEKINDWYIFGLFESTTGEENPWFLKPSITFPLIFIILGVAFYVSLALGGISERGIPRVDELDQVVMTTTSTFFMGM